MKRKKWNFWLVARIVILFFGGMFVAAVIALSQINLESYRGKIIHTARAATGLPIEIDGKISWKFGVRPRVSLAGIRIPNAEWAKHPDAVKIGRADATLDLLSLLSGRVTVSHLKIANLELFLEENEKREYSLKGTGGKVQSMDKKYPFDWNFGLDSVELIQPKISIPNHYFAPSALKIEYREKDGKARYSGYISKNFEVYPFIISFLPLNEERKVYPIKVALAAHGKPIVADIALEQTSRIPIDFIVKGTISDLQKILAGFDIAAPRIEELNVNLAGGMTHSRITLRKSNINNLEISGNYDWSSAHPAASLKIKSKNSDLTDLFPDLEKESEWVRPKRKLNVFKDVPLYDYFPRGIDFTIYADIARLNVYRELDLKDIVADAYLKNGKLEVDAKLKIASGDIHVRAVVNDDGKALQARAAGMAERVYVGEILESVREKDTLSELPMNVEFYLQSHGRDLSQIMSNLNGPVYTYSVGKGFAHEDLVRYFYGQDFLTGLQHSAQDLFRSKKKYNRMSLNCAAVNIKLRDGRVETERGVAIETNAVNIRAVGNIDFGKETMKMSMATTPVRGLKLSLTGNLMGTMEFSGSLAEPDLTINGGAVAAKAVSATGIGLLLAPFTGGIGLVAGAGIGLLVGDVLENWLADEHPCRTAMKDGAPILDNDPDWMKRPMAELVEEGIGGKG